MIASKLAFNGLKFSKNFTVRLYTITSRNLANDVKTGAFRRSIRSKFAEATAEGAATKTVTDTPLRMGRGFLAGASAIGLTGLAYYGLGLSNEVGILDKSMTWPQFVRERIRTTYGYVAGSLLFTAGSAISVARSPALMRIASSNSIFAIIASFAAVIGSGMLVRMIPYEPNTFGSKQAAWLLHSALLGAFIAPMAILGGPLLVKAAWYTAGVVGGLSLIAATAPSEKFLNMAGPLAIGMGVVFASSLAGMFLPATTTLGLSLYSISIYGGLVLFSMFLLYDTQKIVHKAETSYKFDPVNESISIYLDILNIFMRIAMILSGGGSRKK